MNQYDQINNNYQEKIHYNNNTNEITEEINQSISNNFSQLEQDISILINFLRTNPLEFCDNLVQKNKFRQNQDQINIINFIEEINKNHILSEYTEIPELSNAARYLLDKISQHYRTYHDLNLKEIEPNVLNLRVRLSNFGERTGRIFETVLFKMDNPEDIVYHILKEEKGRNMLLSHKMKYIGIACDMLPSNFLCTVIDIVQDFVPFREQNNINNINNNDINSNYENNFYFIEKNNNSYNNNFNFGNSKRKYFYNQSKSEYMSLLNNLNSKNSKDNLKLKIKSPDNGVKDIEMNLNNIQNDMKTISKNSNINNKNKIIQKIYFKTPIKLGQNLEDNLSPKSDNPNNLNIKKIVPKRNNSNNINIIKKDLKNNNENNLEDIDNIKNIKFTMAGRTYKQQQEIIEKSTKKNLTKSKSVCSFDVNSNYSKNNNKNKFQRLNHEEKMEILHKINHRNNKTPNSQSPSDKNSENATNLISNKKSNDDFIQKNSSNNFEINFENKSKKSPSRSTYNQEYYDLNSETDKNNYNILNKFMNKDDKNNYDDGTNQTFTDLKSNQGIGNNEEYSKNKISEIKNELLNFKNKIKKELKDEVREEIRNEFNKKILLENKQRNKPTLIQFAPDYDMQMQNNNSNYNESKRNSYDLNNDVVNEKIYYKNVNIRNNNYYNKNKDKNRWTSVEKYYYIKNNNNNINNINNTNIILPDNEIQYKQYTQNNYYKGNKPRKSFDLKEFINNNNNNNINRNNINGNDNDDGIQLKEKYEQLKYIPIMNNNDRMYNNDNMSNYSRGSFQKEYISKETSNKKNMNASYFNEGYKMNNRQEIKKLIKLYNIAKEDKRNKSIIENNNVYDIINNNKSISNYNFDQNKSNNDNMKIDINDDLSNNKKIINNKTIGNNLGNNNSNLEIVKNEFRDNYNYNYNNNYINNPNTINNEEEDYSTENDFVKGHRFQIKYEKVKPKGQLYNKSLIPKPRNASVKKPSNFIYSNINNDSKSYINDNPFNRNEDIVNLENTFQSNETSNKEPPKDKEKEYKIEKTSYIKKYDEITTYNMENTQNNINNTKNTLNSIDKLSVTGKFIEENNSVDNANSNNNNPNLKSNDSVDIKNFMDKNITYNELKDKPIISKREKMDNNNLITTIITKTRKIYTPNKTNNNNNEEYVINKKVHKKQSDLIKEYKKYEKIDDYNDIRSNDGNNNYIGNKKFEKYDNKIITKKVSLARKAYDKNKINDNNYKNKMNYIEIENDSLKTPNQFKKTIHLYDKEYFNNTNMSPRFHSNLNSNTNSHYKKKKYSPYPYYPYEYTVNYKDNNIIPSRRLNYNNGSVEKKYIKDPEGNLIETYVKKTKYNDGSVLLEYI